MIQYYKKDFNFDSFEFWSGAYDRIQEATEEQKKQVEERLNDCFSDETPTDTEINDFVWFECDDIFYDKD